MPKMKKNKSAVKRFKLSKSGLLKRRCANKNHILTKKSTQRKRNLRFPALINKADKKSVCSLLRII